MDPAFLPFLPGETGRRDRRLPGLCFHSKSPLGRARPASLTIANPRVTNTAAQRLHLRPVSPAPAPGLFLCSFALSTENGMDVGSYRVESFEPGSCHDLRSFGRAECHQRRCASGSGGPVLPERPLLCALRNPAGRAACSRPPHLEKSLQGVLLDPRLLCFVERLEMARTPAWQTRMNPASPHSWGGGGGSPFLGSGRSPGSPPPVT